MKSDWKKVKLGDVVPLKYGKGLTSDSREKGTVPVYGSSGVNGYHKTALVNESGLVIGRKGNVGSIYKVNGPFYPIDTTYYVTKSEINGNYDYFYYLLGTLRLKESNADSVIPGLSREYFNSIDISLPPLPVQKSIAQVLSSLDDKIELLREQNKTLEALAQTLFKRWFVDFEFPNENGQPYKSSGGKMVESELGLIPEGWRIGILNDFIGELQSGRRPKGGVGNLIEGIPSVGAESINGISNFDFSKTKYISTQFFEKMNAGKVKDYDILVYKDGGTPGTFLPRFSMSGEGFPFKVFAINEHVFRVQTKLESQRFYFYLWINTFGCKRELQNIGGKAAIPGINSTDFKNISLLLPSENTLNQFHNLVSTQFRKILKNNNHIGDLSQTRNQVLPKLMKGEIEL